MGLRGAARGLRLWDELWEADRGIAVRCPEAVNGVFTEDQCGGGRPTGPRGDLRCFRTRSDHAGDLGGDLVDRVIGRP